MARNSGKVHVVRVKKTGYVDKQGRARDYSSAYLRRTYRDGGTVKNETVANLSALPDHVIDLIDAGLKGQQLVPAGQAVTITRSVPHGHVAAVHAMAAKLGLPALLGPAGRHRDLALALVISRVARPGSKLSTLAWWADTTLGADLGVAEASTDDIYAAMDWLAGRQDAIEAGLARRHLAPEPNPARMALFDLSSSWLEGTRARWPPAATPGTAKGGLQIEYGLLTDPDGRPVAVRVFPGNTGDPAAFTGIVQVVRDKFGLAKMVMVGDRGMITSARIAALNQPEDGTAAAGCLRVDHRAARPGDQEADGRRRAAAAVTCSMSRTWPRSPPRTIPGERLIACRNPVLAADRARKREDLLAATEKLLAPLIARVQAGRLAGAAAIGVEVGKVISKYKTGKHFERHHHR